MIKTRLFWRQLWRLTLPYWTSDERWSARGLLAVIVAMNLSLVGISVLFNQWNNDFYNALQDKDEARFWSELQFFCILAALYILIAVYQLWLNQYLQIRWRRWLTEHYLNQYLSHHVYWRLQIEDRSTDNPDQRLTDDVKQFVQHTLSIGLGLMNAVVTLVSFVGILWGLSGAIEVFGLTIMGYMVWVAILYALVGSVAAHLIGRPLVGLNFRQEAAEADFRFGLVRLRESVDGVALGHGAERERAGFLGLFGFIVTNWRAIMTCQKRLTFFTVGYAQIATIFPFVVAAPRFFSGAIPLGGLMQTASAFGQVQQSLSWFIETYPRLADWAAVVERLTGFTAAIAANSTGGEGGPVLVPGDRLAITNLTLTRPDGVALVEAFSLSLAPGERVLLMGRSGSGKTTVFRTLAGLWRHGSGTVTVPADSLFLPQRPYLPIGTLADAICYPADTAAVAPEVIEAALRDVGLQRFADRLWDPAPWAQLLSGGEQQRLAFARVLLQRPRWLFLDEATAGLDQAGEQQLYRLLLDRLPETAVLSIGHRDTLVSLHHRVVRLG